MKKSIMLALSMVSLVFVGCKSSYPNLKDGLYADIQTSKGNMVVELFYKQTPITVANFVSLAEGTNTLVSDSLKNKPYYNGTVFHRVIKNFMIQGGDPTATGMGSPGYKFGDEFIDTLKFVKKGQLAMANAGPSTNGSQFFITQIATDWLTGKHTIFGQVVEGESVIDSIANIEVTATSNRPVQDVVIKNVRIVRKGTEAKAFDAAKIFSNYMKEQDELARQREEKRKQEHEKFLQEVKNQMEQAQILPAGVKIYSMKEGNGIKPTQKDKVLVIYSGFLANNLTLFDSNDKQVAEKFGRYNQQRDMFGGYEPMPFEFNQQASLIPGFKAALLTMKVGDKIRAFIPSALAYGEVGSGNGVIPPNSDLIFDIEIIDIAK